MVAEELGCEDGLELEELGRFGSVRCEGRRRRRGDVLDSW